MPSDWQLKTNYGHGYGDFGGDDCLGWCACCCCCIIICMLLVVV